MATALKLARVTAGWSQTQVLTRMRQAAAAVGEELPGRASLRVQLSQWENGHRRPCEFYRRVFCAVYHRPPEHLGFPTIAADAVPGGIVADVVAALLYTAPLTTEELRAVPPARVRLYTAVAAADPHTPALTELTAGLRQARAHPPAWLDRDRLHVCDTAAHQASSTYPTATTTVAGRVPDWVTTGRLTSSVTAAAALIAPAQ